MVGTSKVARDPYGQLVATNVGVAGSVVMANPHGDVNALIDPSNTVTNGSRSYDPFGVATTSGTANAFGFQGQASNAAGRVNMQSRWYDPGTGTFTARDTFAMSAPRAGGAVAFCGRSASESGIESTKCLSSIMGSQL